AVWPSRYSGCWCRAGNKLAIQSYIWSAGRDSRPLPSAGGSSVTCTASPGPRNRRRSAASTPALSTRPARVRVGSTRRRIISRRRAPSGRASIRTALRASPSEDHSPSAPAAPGSGDCGSGDCVRGAVVSAFAVSVTDAIEGFDLCEFRVDGLELLAQALDVAIDRAVIDIDVLAIGRVHQLVAVFDVPRALSQRLEDQELGHSQLDRAAAP